MPAIAGRDRDRQGSNLVSRPLSDTVTAISDRQNRQILSLAVRVGAVRDNIYIPGVHERTQCF